MNRDMPRKMDKYVIKERNRHGKIVFYFREGKGKRIRLPAPNSPDYKAAYRAALSGSPIKHHGPTRDTLAWAWEKYTTESVKWSTGSRSAYTEATKKQQRLIMAQVIKEHGNESLGRVTQSVIQASVDRRAETPAAAINFLKTMTGLFTWAKRMGLVEVNPCIGIDRPKYKTGGFPAWSMGDVDSYRERHPIGSMARLAMELMLLTGLRRSDVVLAGLQHLRGNVLTLKTAKTGATITAYLPDALLAMVKATPRKGLHFLETSFHKPFVKEGFGNWFRERCEEAGVDKSAHGLRKLSATLAAEGGAASHQLMAQYGWTNLATAEVYTRGIDRARLGIEASRIVAEQIENRNPRTSESGAGETAKKG